MIFYNKQSQYSADEGYIDKNLPTINCEKTSVTYIQVQCEKSKKKVRRSDWVYQGWRAATGRRVGTVRKKKQNANPTRQAVAQDIVRETTVPRYQKHNGNTSFSQELFHIFLID